MKDSDKDDEKKRIRFGGDDSPHQDPMHLGQPSRPALVTSPDHSRNAGRKIRFDEAAIAEHDLERGTRMTIDEPDTPFVRTPMSSGESSEDSSSTYGGRGEHVRLGEVSREARLQNLTNGVVDHTNEPEEGRNGLRIDFSSTEAEEAEERERERKAREFHEKRRKHYNEMQMVRAMRAQGRLDTSEEEDDAERQQQQPIGEQLENCRSPITMATRSSQSTSNGTTMATPMDAKRMAEEAMLSSSPEIGPTGSTADGAGGKETSLGLSLFRKQGYLLKQSSAYFTQWLERYVTLEGPMLKVFTTAAHHQPRQSVFLGRVAVEGMWSAKENEDDGYGEVWSFVIRWPPPVKSHEEGAVDAVSWPPPSELEFLHIGSYDQQECEEWFRAVKQAIISIDRTYRIQSQYRQRRLSSDNKVINAEASSETQTDKVRSHLPDRLKSKYPTALEDAHRLDQWEPVFAGHGSQISVNTASPATKFRLVHLLDGMDSKRVWSELSEGTFGTWLTRLDGSCFQPIAVIAADKDSGVTTDLASLFIGDENLRGLKLRADLIRSHIDNRKEMLATTSEDSFEGQGRRVEIDYMFWRVEDLPNSQGSSITCIISIAPSTRQKDAFVQRLVKYLLPNLRRAQGLIARVCSGAYDRSRNPVYDIWFRHIWKLEEYLNSGAKKGDFEPGRNDPRTFDYELSEKKLRNSKTGEKISETEQAARTQEILGRVRKTAAETGQVCPTELDCRRYLMASDWNTEDAFTKLRDTLAWRLSTFGVGHPPRGIDPDSITTERRKGALYPRGRDKHGRPILILRPRLTEPRERDEDEFERYLIYSVERCVSKMVDRGEGASASSQLIVLADMSRCGYKNFDVPSTKAIIELLKDRYPERVGLVLVTNLNWVGKQFWNIIRPSLSTEMVSKIRLVPRDDPLEYLSRFIEPRHIPASCGGSDTYVYSIENDDLFSDNEE